MQEAGNLRQPQGLVRSRGPFESLLRNRELVVLKDFGEKKPSLQKCGRSIGAGLFS